MVASSVGFIWGFLLLSLVACAATRSTAFRNQTADHVTARHPTRPACDLAYSIAAKTPGVSIQRSTGVFTDEALRRPVRGCRLVITGSFSHAAPGEDAVNRLRDGFAARGWQEMPAYSADGKDGTAFALRKTDIACLFRGTWNAGTDDEPSMPGEEAYGVSVLCTSPVPPEERWRQ